MFSKLFLLISLTASTVSLAAQESQQAASAPTRKEIYAKQAGKFIFPLIKGSIMTGVLPVKNITNKVDPNTEVKLIFDFTQGSTKDAEGTSVNEGLEEVARIMNLHIAAGTKKEKLKTTIIFHSVGSFVSLNNEYYQGKFGTTNPNIHLLNQLVAAGTTLAICGQTLQLRELNPNYLLPSIQIAFSAKTTLSKYQHLGYQVFLINDK